MGFQRKSPYKAAFDQKILELQGAGLIGKWKLDALESLNRYITDNSFKNTLAESLYSFGNKLGSFPGFQAVSGFLC